MTAADRIQNLKNQIAGLGPVLPGSISQQWNVCGKAGCRCKDPKKPRKHGPYYQLSFTIGGKSSSLFLRKEEVLLARQVVARNRTFRRLCAELTAAYVAAARRQGLAELCQQASNRG